MLILVTVLVILLCDLSFILYIIFNFVVVYLFFHFCFIFNYFSASS